MRFSHFDPGRILRDIDLSAREGILRVRVSAGGNCTVSLLTRENPLPMAKTPGVIRDMGLDCFPVPLPSERMTPLGSQSAQKLLSSLEQWATNPNSELSYILALEPLGFILRGAVDDVGFLLELTDAREAPSENRYLLHLESAAVEPWPTQEKMAQMQLSKLSGDAA